MTNKNIDIAKSKLNGDISAVLINGNEVIALKGHGISPVLKLIESNKNYSDYSLADIVVGKAVATLFVKLGIRNVYARLISVPAYEYLNEHDVNVQYTTIVPNILNRNKNDICPMEKAVENISDYEQAYTILKDRYEQMLKKLNCN